MSNNSHESLPRRTHWSRHAFQFPFPFLSFPLSASSLSFLFARKSSFGADDRIHDTRVPRFLERRRGAKRAPSGCGVYACDPPWYSARVRAPPRRAPLSRLALRFRFRWLAGRAFTHVRNLTVRSTSVEQRGAENGGCGGSRPRVSRSNKSNISPVNPNPLVPVVYSRGENGVSKVGSGGGEGGDARSSHPTVPCRDDL